MAVRDPKTEWIRVRGYRAMTPQRRSEIAQDLIRTGRSIVENAIHKQRPGLSPREFELELWNRIYSRAWAARVRDLARKERKRMADWEVVAQVIQVVEENNIPYAIVGGYSVIYWGRPRFTQDADLLVNLPSSKVSALHNATSAEFVVSREAMEDAVQRRGEFNLIHQAEVFKTDLWIAGTPYNQEVLKRRRRGALGSIEAYYQSPEDTILSKLCWYKQSNFSERHFTDALGVYEVQEPTLDQAYLDKWARELQIEDLLARVRADAVRPVE